MKFYSEKLNKLYETQEALEKAEAEKEAKELEAKKAAEKRNAERKDAAHLVDEKRKIAWNAYKEYHDALKDFCSKYDSYHYSLKDDDLKNSDWYTLLKWLF